MQWPLLSWRRPDAPSPVASSLDRSLVARTLAEQRPLSLASAPRIAGARRTRQRYSRSSSPLLSLCVLFGLLGQAAGRSCCCAEGLSPEDGRRLCDAEKAKGFNAVWISDFETCCLTRERVWRFGSDVEPGSCPRWLFLDTPLTRLTFSTPVANATGSNMLDPGTCDLDGGLMAMVVVSHTAQIALHASIWVFPPILHHLIEMMPDLLLYPLVALRYVLPPLIDDTARIVYIVAGLFEAARHLPQHRLPALLDTNLDWFMQREVHLPLLALCALLSWYCLGDSMWLVDRVWHIVAAAYGFRLARDDMRQVAQVIREADAVPRDPPIGVAAGAAAVGGAIAGAAVADAAAGNQRAPVAHAGADAPAAIQANAAGAVAPQATGRAPFQTTLLSVMRILGRVTVWLLRDFARFGTLLLIMASPQLATLAVMRFMGAEEDRLEYVARTLPVRPPRYVQTYGNALFAFLMASPLIFYRRDMVASWRVLRRSFERTRACLTARPVPRRLPEGDEQCPICCDTMEEGGERGPLEFCRWGCGRAVHASCMREWRRQKNECIFCQAWWG